MVIIGGHFTRRCNLLRIDFFYHAAAGILSLLWLSHGHCWIPVYTPV